MVIWLWSVCSALQQESDLHQFKKITCTLLFFGAYLAIHKNMGSNNNINTGISAFPQKSKHTIIVNKPNKYL